MPVKKKEKGVLCCILGLNSTYQVLVIFLLHRFGSYSFRYFQLEPSLRGAMCMNWEFGRLWFNLNEALLVGSV